MLPGVSWAGDQFDAQYMVPTFTDLRHNDALQCVCGRLLVPERKCLRETLHPPRPIGMYRAGEAPLDCRWATRLHTTDGPYDICHVPCQHIVDVGEVMGQLSLYMKDTHVSSELPLCDDRCGGPDDGHLHTYLNEACANWEDMMGTAQGAMKQWKKQFTTEPLPVPKAACMYIHEGLGPKVKALQLGGVGNAITKCVFPL